MKGDKNTQGRRVSDQQSVQFLQRFLPDRLEFLDSRMVTQAVASPFEAYQKYKDQTTSIRLEVIEIPVEKFVAEVRDKPTDAELEKLFKEYRNAEYRPELAPPGFKRLRQVRVEWISGSPSLPFFTKKHEEFQKNFPIQSGMLASGYAAHFVTTAPVEKAYQKYLESVKNEQKWTLHEAGHFSGQKSLHDTSIHQPSHVKELIGGLFGGIGTGAPAGLTAPLAFLSLAQRKEIDDRVQIGLQSILYGHSDPLLAMGPTLAAVPAPLPAEAVKSVITKEQRDKSIRDGFEKDFTDFQKKITETAQKKQTGWESNENKAALSVVVGGFGHEGLWEATIRKTIDDFVRERGLDSKKSSVARDIFSLDKEESLKPLVDLFNDSIKAPDQRTGRNPVFGSELISSITMTPQEGARTSLYHANWYRDRPQATEPLAQTYRLAWLIEDQEAKSFRDWKEAREQVENAWRLEKARKLAREKADQLRNQAQQTKGRFSELWDLSKNNGFRHITLKDISKLKIKESAFASGPSSAYEPFSIQDISNKDVVYPNDDMPQKLLSLQAKQPGESIVYYDKPKRHYYVITLEGKTEPQSPDFLAKVYGEGRDSFFQDHIEPDVARRSLREAMTRLRAEARYTEGQDYFRDSPDSQEK
jgi:hypothetical protein